MVIVVNRQSFTLDNASAGEFLEVYKGVVPEYPAMVAALTAGTTIALEVRRLQYFRTPHSISTQYLFYLS